MRTELNSHKVDPVCGMNLAAVADTETTVHKGKTLYFCSTYCRDRFVKDPERFGGQPVIALHDVWKIFKLGATEVKVLRGLDLRIWKGDFVSIIGPSGSGKSTALNIIGLLDRPTSGAVILHGRDVSMLSDDARAELRYRTFGFVFQQYNLIPWLTAYENVSLPLILAGKTVNKERLEANFAEIGLKERMAHRPFELSGGEQQRTAILRALTNDPDIVICDEPTGNLDSATGNLIMELLMKLNKDKKKTLIVVTHDADIADRADQIMAIKDGRLVRDHKAHKRLYTERSHQ